MTRYDYNRLNYEVKGKNKKLFGASEWLKGEWDGEMVYVVFQNRMESRLSFRRQ